MSHRLPKEVVNQFCEDTPFTGQEIQRLWRRFQALDRMGDGEGTLTLAVSLRCLDVISCSSLHLALQHDTGATGRNHLLCAHSRDGTTTLSGCSTGDQGGISYGCRTSEHAMPTTSVPCPKVCH
jgi:hypothetical protein